MAERRDNVGIGAQFASFVQRTDYAALPDTVRYEARRSLLNFLGCALGVARSQPVEQAIGVYRLFGRAPVATIIGRSERLDVLGASFVNAVAGNLLDYDDTHLNTVIHPTAPVAPPVLALAEAQGFSGREVLTAFALGAEIECRIGNGVSPGHYARGWHITSTCGVFGAAAASAKLLGLSTRRIADALGIAASQSAGLVENLPSAAKNVSVGSAARNGLFAALLARAGYDAVPTAIEGPLGWARAMGDAPDTEAMLVGLGDTWELARNTYKPYPSGIVFHAVTDACLALRRNHCVNPDAIRRVTVWGDSLLLARGDRPVNTARDARVSIHHTAAIALLRGTANVSDYEMPTVMDPNVRAFRAKVHAELATELPRGAACVELLLADGRVLSTTVLHAHGSAEHPLRDAEIETKVRDCAATGSADCDVERIIDLVWTLDTQPDTKELMAVLAASRV